MLICGIIGTCAIHHKIRGAAFDSFIDEAQPHPMSSKVIPMSSNFNYLLQELKKLDDDILPFAELVKNHLQHSTSPEARERVLAALDGINRLRKLTYQFPAESQRHNWHIALDRHQQMYHMILEDVIRAESA